jgi:hypothetical protein
MERRENSAAKMGFKEAISRIKKQTSVCELNILVWGPGTGAVEHFEKRQKIKQEISRSFPNADVRFSEDLDLTEALPGIEQANLAEQELWHLAACDLCVVLDTSKGAGEEIAYFVRSQLAYKLLILTHEQHAASTTFPSALRKYQNQLTYNDHQYDSCTLVDHVITRVNGVALGKLFGWRV